MINKPTVFDCRIDHILTEDTGYTTDLRISMNGFGIGWLLYILVYR